MSSDDINSDSNDEELFNKVRAFVESPSSDTWEDIGDPEEIIKKYILYLNENDKTDDLDELKLSLKDTGHYSDFFC